MKTLLCGMAILTAIAAPAIAGTRYDRNLEKAAVDIVASRMGHIRGGFSYKQLPQLVVPPDAASASAAPVERPRREVARDRDDGLSPAVERQAPRTIF
ncbi:MULTISPECIES: hypothetical protein [unclassified Mesorhizobium]|uniref:hypothetical protein n=1 Tax=unclassified Mesorhizobium TaxID=325217 RepID=UPI001128ED64|nr:MULTISPECIES: hypothetical protein [unclassified Mesorhizobium]MBZ9957396.1 hypothetical protein [Mesorhizobium sp. BR1-1-14]MCA0056143.1 hypothetical protein [Mesorhizobium sp. B261B1A]TPJ55136.1 hypothetical protein FJ426_05120 [Mesorhizobium sp. B2-6-4]TPK32992.1 hypothetical protein FJ867_19530 [Mesorhizobium sp. B2-5-3]TPK59370.1 hypothetical protein FJ551_24545 [Mesorhizobium sp. B2-5-1]